MSATSIAVRSGDVVACPAWPFVFVLEGQEGTTPEGEWRGRRIDPTGKILYGEAPVRVAATFAFQHLIGSIDDLCAGLAAVPGMYEAVRDDERALFVPFNSSDSAVGFVWLPIGSCVSCGVRYRLTPYRCQACKDVPAPEATTGSQVAPGAPAVPAEASGRGGSCAAGHGGIAAPGERLCADCLRGLRILNGRETDGFDKLAWFRGVVEDELRQRAPTATVVCDAAIRCRSLLAFVTFAPGDSVVVDAESHVTEDAVRERVRVAVTDAADRLGRRALGRK